MVPFLLSRCRCCVTLQANSQTFAKFAAKHVGKSFWDNLAESANSTQACREDPHGNTPHDLRDPKCTEIARCENLLMHACFAAL